MQSSSSSSSGGLVYSAEGGIALVDGTSRRVLKLRIPNSDGTTDWHPKNLKPGSRGSSTRKPGDNVEWYVKSIPGDKADTIFRTKLADFLAEHFGFKGEDQWVIDSLPSGYGIYTFQKVQVDANGVDNILRADKYVFGHPGGFRFRSPNEMAPHLIALVYQNRDSLSGHPKNHQINYNPSYDCPCQHCAKKEKERESMADKTPQQAQKDTAIKANIAQAKAEALKDIKDGAWKFRMGEIVWVYTRFDLPELGGPGGAWLACLIIGVPELASFTDISNIYTSVHKGRGMYRAQEIGSDTHVFDAHISDILPWIKVPRPDATLNMAIDTRSGNIAKSVARSKTAIAPSEHFIEWETPGKLERSRTVEMQGVYFGPEKIWVGDAVRIPRSGAQLSAELSIWDPRQYDVLIVRKIIIHYKMLDPEAGDKRKNIVEDQIMYYFSGDVLTTYPNPDDKVAEIGGCIVPNYIKNIGTGYPKWVLRVPPPGKNAIVSFAVPLGRFYDPRWIALMEKRAETYDIKLELPHYCLERGRSLGLTQLNGEPLRESGRLLPPEPKPNMIEPMFGEGVGSDMFTLEERAAMAPDMMTDDQLAEYRQISGALSAPKSGEGNKEPHQKKRRYD